MLNKVAFYTLGCKLNFAETDTIINKFLKKGYEYVKFISYADLYIINTCSVTKNAEKELKKLVRIAINNNVNAFIVAIGCYSQVNPKEISLINGIDLIIGSKEKFNIISHLKKKSKKKYLYKNLYIPSYSRLNRTRSYLKIQDGCDYKCSYCTITKARGFSISDNIKNIIFYAKNIIKQGIKEIVLTGVNIGDYGKQNLLELIQAIESYLNEEDIKRIRIRISSIEPNLLSDDIINFIYKSKIFVNHFHIPLQSGSDEILNKMKRRYSKNIYLERIKKILNIMPLACIGSDVIVGFPGEKEKNFLETYSLLSEINISYLHVFSYSERINTKAFIMNNSINKKIRYKRNKILIRLSKEKKNIFYIKQINKKRNVLFENKNKSGYIYGYTDNYIRTKTIWKSDLVNNIKNVTLLNIDDCGNMICK
ncbi:tRNA (N(6)-L-threonylcarbamoyladenosine(37)-C(2))-methylthiotransferase MtaB [Candidatus Karelsulcia muelleri]|uniref:tRNA (N(6)-L-threonylcarbamoyladenosine(37)-C(2))- methylthiotransferase MtaB n=1 Tax=Candidatus Karelsulcia muelleri TaxID=336810 RepID=UPI0007F9F0E5|nr:tRNA (N(6)-L-threonylcarbamoyladenosine(37)-C(2))-methylthiotransferase MtaB [Candidatus Karelsulcia muelleri]ANO35744.1 tRNA (N(6)-L-threonylcarbamoyladenosine(37)-C(2))-methylthiotransferase MtaB [Candidatus Karelsulcia muelleri]QSF25135.1 tRNA (N(6)-L-threonylcarbamoyladenosine(37)-C(2))-methylthiotransferase MtaB [Candidatus Karelsulcia muelleri]